MVPTTLQVYFPNTIFIHDFHFVFPGTDNQTLRDLVQAAPEGVEPFLEGRFWIMVADR
jgi:hypothetical protein